MLPRVGPAVEGRADLVDQHRGAGPRDLGELAADQFVEGLSAQGTGGTGDADDIGVRRQRGITAPDGQDRVHSVAVRLR
jgi:hypothetical protein